MSEPAMYQTAKNWTLAKEGMEIHRPVLLRQVHQVVIVAAKRVRIQAKIVLHLPTLTHQAVLHHLIIQRKLVNTLTRIVATVTLTVTTMTLTRRIDLQTRRQKLQKNFGKK